MRKTIKVKSIVSLFTLVLMTMMLITTFSTKSEATCYSGCKPNCQYDGHFSKSYSDYYKNLGYYGQTKSVVSGKYVQGWWMYYSKDIKVEPGNTYTVNFTVSADHYYRNGELNFGITEPYEMSVVKRPAGIVNEKTSLPNNSQNINAYTNNFGYYSCYGPTVNVKYTFTVDENFQGEYATFLLEQDKAKDTCYTKHYTWNYKMGEITSVSNNGTVNVVYVDKSGNEIAPQETITGKVGTPYTTEQKDIPGYNFVEVKGNPTGKITAGTQTITYVYDKITTGTVTVKHLRPNGQELAPEEILTGNVGDSYTAEPVKNRPNWHVVRVEGLENGKFTSNPQTVIFHYDRNQAGAVNVTYVDNSGKEIASPETITGKVGDNYSTTQKTIAGYTFLRNEGDPVSGKLTAAEQNVVYIYESVKDSTVIVKYQDVNGKDLAPSETLIGKYGEAYNTNAKIIDNYVLKSTPDNYQGLFTDQVIEVIYVYEECAKCDGTVLVKYVDTKGNEIAPSETLTGKYGETYFTSPIPIENYVLTEIPSNHTGTFIDGELTVTYIYELCADTGQVIVRHLRRDASGELVEIIPDEIMEGIVGINYKTTSLDGYNLQMIFGNAEGIYIEGTQTVIYIYE